MISAKRIHILGVGMLIIVVQSSLNVNQDDLI